MHSDAVLGLPICNSSSLPTVHISPKRWMVQTRDARNGQRHEHVLHRVRPGFASVCTQKPLSAPKKLCRTGRRYAGERKDAATSHQVALFDSDVAGSSLAELDKDPDGILRIPFHRRFSGTDVDRALLIARTLAGGWEALVDALRVSHWLGSPAEDACARETARVIDICLAQPFVHIGVGM